MSLIVVLCFFNFFMSYRWPCSSIQHYQPIEWVKWRSPFENKDTVLTFILGRNESCMQLSYTKGKYFKFYKNRTIHKILVEGKHQTQQLPFQQLKGKPGLWFSSTLGAWSWLQIFHLRYLPCKIPAVQHSDGGISLFKACAFFQILLKNTPKLIFLLTFFFALLRAVLNIHKYKTSVEIPLIIFWFWLLKKRGGKKRKNTIQQPTIFARVLGQQWR